MSDVNTLGDELPKEMARIRDRVMPAYVSIGPAGAFALSSMRVGLDAATKAMVEGDTIAMLRAYEYLRGFDT